MTRVFYEGEIYLSEVSEESLKILLKDYPYQNVNIVLEKNPKEGKVVWAMFLEIVGFRTYFKYKKRKRGK